MHTHTQPHTLANNLATRAFFLLLFAIVSFYSLFFFFAFLSFIRNKTPSNASKENFNYFESLKFNAMIKCMGDRERGTSWAAKRATHLMPSQFGWQERIYSHWKRYKNKIENRLAFLCCVNINHWLWWCYCCHCCWCCCWFCCHLIKHNLTRVNILVQASRLLTKIMHYNVSLIQIPFSLSLSLLLRFRELKSIAILVMRMIMCHIITTLSSLFDWIIRCCESCVAHTTFGVCSSYDQSVAIVKAAFSLSTFLHNEKKKNINNNSKLIYQWSDENEKMELNWFDWQLIEEYFQIVIDNLDQIFFLCVCFEVVLQKSRIKTFIYSPMCCDLSRHRANIWFMEPSCALQLNYYCAELIIDCVESWNRKISIQFAALRNGIVLTVHNNWFVHLTSVFLWCVEK